MKKNIIANFIGKIWGLFSNFIFIPVYIKLLGFSSYSVISYTLVIAGVLTILDSGLTATLSREFSRQDHNLEKKKSIYETLQITYIGIVLSCTFLIILFSGLMVNGLKAEGYQSTEISFFLKLASVDLSFQLLFRFFLGGLIGLNKQVEANIIQVLWGICRNALVILLIYYLPSLNIYFIWQAIMTIVFTFIIKFFLDSKVYERKKFNINLKFDVQSFNSVKGFAGGMLLISIISALSSQGDKIVISKMLSLENLGHYTLAVSLSSVLIIVISPISTAILPQITEYYSLNRLENIKRIFNQYNMLISVIVFSILANVIYFDRNLIEIWTKNPQLATSSYLYVPYVSGAYAFIVLQTMFYQIALANGYTKLNNIIGIINAIIIIPTYYFACKLWGAVGLSVVFMIIQMFNFFIYSFIMNKKFIGENFVKNIVGIQFFFPALIAFIIAYFFHYIMTIIQFNQFTLIFWIGFSAVTSFTVSYILLANREEKLKVKNIVLKYFRKHEK
ncbi:lipopolysaccharide biosynthesis protein [Sphingobacterium multivorum]|uniref:lipopolysaccharide biosynthesis protein n=1 Tax=Sphingobacterium multivorum TaxID=28454 RepID=UPI002896C3D4|nr:oligosaccharide flippase family protein [Sphingobacterium multivorum]